MEAFGIVVFAVVAVAAVLAIVSLVRRDEVYDQIGRGGIGDERETGPREVTGAPPPDSDAERDAEIRQMLEARSARRVAKGRAPVDVDAELAALTATGPGGVDDALRMEVRQLVEARNARLIRRGKAPLDVEAEIERRLRDLPG